MMDRQAANPPFINMFCLLGNKGQGNALLIVSSEIHNPLKMFLLDQDGTAKYGLDCYNV
jgi:hypothetical protein